MNHQPTALKELTTGHLNNYLKCDLMRLLPVGYVGEKLMVGVRMLEKASNGDTDSLTRVKGKGP